MYSRYTNGPFAGRINRKTVKQYNVLPMDIETFDHLKARILPSNLSWKRYKKFHEDSLDHLYGTSKKFNFTQWFTKSRRMNLLWQPISF